MRNKLSISESQGKSGNFFICTDDNELILKTITDDELKLITSSFLKKYCKYLTKNNDSLMCRLYGLFQISLIDKNVNVILMKNVVGKYKPNILCSYDLKGSTLNREVKFDMEKVQKIVMKDNNFEEIEKYLYLNENNIKKLQQISKTDSAFLNKLGLMDYSLLVLKLSMRENEVFSFLYIVARNLLDH
jgi:1-phosphatidylinositol-4-phosphate 5-kinase